IVKMNPQVATSEASVKEPHLPPLHKVGDLIAPTAPQDIASAGLGERVLTDLALKLAYTVARFTTDWVAEQLHLSLALADDVLFQLGAEGLIQETLRTGPGKSHYTITPQGRESAERLMEVCRYVGAAPVHLNAYAAMLRWQFAHMPPVRPEQVST